MGVWGKSNGGDKGGNRPVLFGIIIFSFKHKWLVLEHKRYELNIRFDHEKYKESVLFTKCTNLARKGIQSPRTDLFQGMEKKFCKGFNFTEHRETIGIGDFGLLFRVFP